MLPVHELPLRFDNPSQRVRSRIPAVTRERAVVAARRLLELIAIVVGCSVVGYVLAWLVCTW